jgi:hypothetical protein
MAKIFTTAFWDDEGSKAVISIIAGFVGVLLALWISNHTEEESRKDAFTSMRKAIYAEAVYNKTVLNESFLPNYQQNIVQREFSLRTTEGYFTNDIFLSKVPADLLDALIEYQLQLKRANNFRTTDAMYKYDTIKFRRWQVPLTVAFCHALNRCSYSITAVAQLTSAKANCNILASVPIYSCPEVAYVDAPGNVHNQSKLNRAKSSSARARKKTLSKPSKVPFLGRPKSIADSTVDSNKRREPK